jgi:transglutaminase-like putative cysteine protease
MLLAIHQETVLRYPHPVSYSIQQLRLTPRAEITQRAINWRISAPGRVRGQTDAFGNVAHLMTLDQPHEEIRIAVTGEVETVDEGGHILQESGSAVSPLAYLADTPLTHADEAIRALAARCLDNGRDRLSALRDLMPAVCASVADTRGNGADLHTAAEALSRGAGSNPDQAHLFIACCRARAIPARFVSGYVGLAAEGDMSGHAWVDAWIDHYGWVSFDVSHQRLAGREYCRLAVGRDYLDACPVRSAGPGAEQTRIQVIISAQQ